MASIRFCEICKTEIDAERAAAHPKTRLCGKHAEEIKKYGDEFTLTASQERTNKPNSFKVSLGGIDVSTQRNQKAIDRLRDDYLMESN